MRFNKRKSELNLLRDKVAELEMLNRQLMEQVHGKPIMNDITAWHQKFQGYIAETENIGAAIFNSANGTIGLSPVAQRYFGLKSDTHELTLDDILTYISPDDRAAFQKIIEESVRTEKTSGIEYKIVRSEQEREVKFIASKFKLIEKDGENKLVLFTLVDITKHEKTRKELARIKEKAEESEKFRNIFLSNISREIRIPMNSIMGFAELLNIGNISQQDRDEYVKIIKQQSNLLFKLIDDISEMARFESGDVKVNKSVCNLNLLLNEILGTFNQQKKAYKKENLELKINVPAGKGLISYTDPGRLHQLLSNLIGNSIKFTEKGFIEFGYAKEDEKSIRFFVKDTGIGLTREEQKQIFDRFRLQEETVTKKYEGSGLGLSIAKGIVKLLGGRIWIESEPGQGTTIFFTIEYEEVPKENILELSDNETVQHSVSWKDKLILVVEDDDVNYKFIEAVLLENQARVIRAQNGLQAIELCKSINKIELILMDIKMPEMDGFEATRQIKALNKNIPIIAQTAFAMPEDRERCLRAGCDDHIEKPIEVENLLNKINKFFNR
ncbi:MAG: response regulator [Bacteroidales bacterium]|nr:response regulator [Bacteroidales bacterium]